MGHFVPHTDDELARMLADIGLSSLDELFAAVPAALRLAGGLDLPAGLSEPDVLAEMERLAGAQPDRRRPGLLRRGRRLRPRRPVGHQRADRSARSSSPPTPPTSPRWPRASCRPSSSTRRWSPAWPACRSPTPPSTTGPAPRVEAVNLAAAATGRQTIWVSGGIHPHWRARCWPPSPRGTGHRLVDVPLARRA